MCGFKVKARVIWLVGEPVESHIVVEGATGDVFYAWLYFWVPAAEEAGTQGQLLDRQKENSCSRGGLHVPHVHINILTSRPPSSSARERSIVRMLCSV